MPRTYKAGLITGLAVSLGVALLAPAFRPVVSRWGRPVAKGMIKGGLEAYELTRERVAEIGEHVEDLVAEAQVERLTERLGTHGAGPGAS
ncbi:MAG TPA: DUF5132 domain-containing protein [Rhodopila sp.]|jgi:hypothetical protein|nr:DUF5132 domain-containing protein [Rhodopila sp.]